MASAGQDVVDVGAEHEGQVLLILVVPFAPDGRGAVLDPAEGGFAFDEEAQFVAGVEELFRGGIVRRADVVAVAGLEDFGIAAAKLGGEAAAAQRVNFVMVHAVQFDGASVDKQLVAADFDLTQTDALAVLLNTLAVNFQSGGQRVEVGRFGIPQVGVAHGEPGGGRTAVDGLACRGNGAAVAVLQLVFEGGGLRGAVIAGYIGNGFERGVTVALVEGRAQVERGDVGLRQGKEGYFAEQASYGVGRVLRQAAEPVVAALHLEDDDFLAALVFEDFRRDARARNRRRPDLGGFAFADVETLHGPFAGHLDGGGDGGRGAEVPRAVQTLRGGGGPGHGVRTGRQTRQAVCLCVEREAGHGGQQQTGDSFFHR